MRSISDKYNRYYDTSAAKQVIGCSILSPSFLDEDGRYFYNTNDFITDLDKAVFGAIYELHHTGAKNLTLNAIDSWFQNKPTEYGVYNAANGAEYIKSLVDAADVANFDYYYGRLKKMSLLRGYVKAGVNVDWLYDVDDFTENKAKQDKAIDRMSLTDMADLIDNKIEIVKDECVNGITHDSVRIGDGIENLLNVLADTPEVGASFVDPVYTAITRGARKGKYYLRSAPTGIGRVMPI